MTILLWAGPFKMSVGIAIGLPGDGQVRVATISFSSAVLYRDGMEWTGAQPELPQVQRRSECKGCIATTHSSHSLHSLHLSDCSDIACTSVSNHTHPDAPPSQPPKPGTMLGRACIGTMALLAVILRSQASPVLCKWANGQPCISDSSCLD